MIPAHWSAWLEPHEMQALRESDAWIRRPSGAFARAMKMMDRPLELAYERVPEGMKESVGRTVHGALHTALTTSEMTLQERKVLDELCAQVGFEVLNLAHVRRLDLRALDRVARRSMEFHRRAAAVEGGASGLAGLPGLLVDIPALYGLIFRLIQEVSLIYGFPVHTDDEKAHILKVLDVGHRMEAEDRRRGMEELEAVQGMLRTGVPAREIEKQILVRGLQALAEKLGLGLTKRKLAQAIAILGSLVGAGVNWQLLTDVGETAYHTYRRRFLTEVALERQRTQEGDRRPTRPLI